MSYRNQTQNSNSACITASDRDGSDSTDITTIWNWSIRGCIRPLDMNSKAFHLELKVQKALQVSGGQGKQENKVQVQNRQLLIHASGNLNLHQEGSTTFKEKAETHPQDSADTGNQRERSRAGSAELRGLQLSTHQPEDCDTCVVLGGADFQQCFSPGTVPGGASFKRVI